MAQTLVIAGIPYSLTQRLRWNENTISGWRLRIVPGTEARRAGIHETQMTDIFRAATGRAPLDDGTQGTAELGGHVLAFGDRDRAIPEAINLHLRFRWLPNSHLGLLPGDVSGFVRVIQEEADFESDWTDEVQPRSLDSGLLLPEPSFRPQSQAMVWTEVARVGPSSPPEARRADLGRVAAMAREFEGAHRFRDCYRDARDLEFRRGPRHAHHVEERWRWKYSWRLEPGFHFDVSHANKREFPIRDHVGDEHRVATGSYINVDCHGRCR